MLAASLQPRSLPRTQNRDEWKANFSFAGSSWVGHGGSGSVFAIDDDRVIKVFSQDEEGQMDLEREWMIYDKLQSGGYSSRNVIKFYEQWASGLVLERLSCTLRQHLAKLPQCTRASSAPQWIRECCEGLVYLHQNGVLHSDLGCQNILLGKDNHAKLCDFAGSKVGDDEAWISYEARSQHPDYLGSQPTQETELFALGSVIFEIWTCRPPYVSEADSSVYQKFLKRDFPLSSIEDQAIQEIVSKCWNGVYNSVTEVCDELDSEALDSLGSEQVLSNEV
ncbi:Serine threonine-kinase [Hyphodiscus hymeniophilus]|uniref:Serine threonine-kinase n=1 Tax=Hyphodiscus hymeniophilus TaxID=353542 RepID=A0A9P6VEN7_9HELO|nr:Serine threonine-kinase [Hyphodiscus hymeniophilus]